MPSTSRVYAMMKSGRWVTNGQFANAGILCYSRGISELRDKGYRIEKKRVKSDGGTWKYRIVNTHNQGGRHERKI